MTKVASSIGTLTLLTTKVASFNGSSLSFSAAGTSAVASFPLPSPSYTCVWILACIFLIHFVLDFLVALKISFGAKLFSTCITLDVFMACSVHVNLPLVFEDACLRRAFSSNTNELTIPTYCVLNLLVVHQISLDYRAIVTITTTEYLRIVKIVTSTRSV